MSWDVRAGEDQFISTARQYVRAYTSLIISSSTRTLVLQAGVRPIGVGSADLREGLI